MVGRGHVAASALLPLKPCTLLTKNINWCRFSCKSGRHKNTITLINLYRNGFMHLKKRGGVWGVCKNRRGNYVICSWAIINECWRNYSKQLANSIAVWKMDVLLKTRLACYSTWLQQKIQKLAHTGRDPLLFGVIKQSLFLQQQKKKITLMYLQNKMFGMLVWNPRSKKKEITLFELRQL